MLKLIVSDLDGSLLKNQGISPGNMEALKTAQAQGGKLVIATGRDYKWITSLINKYNLDCYSITGNGAEFRDPKGNLVESAYLKPEKYKDVTKHMLTMNIPFMIYTSEGYYSEQDPFFVAESFFERGKKRFTGDIDERRKNPEWPCNQLQHIQDIDAFLATNPQIIKIEAFTIVDPLPINELKCYLEGDEEISYLSSFDDNLEVTAYDAQKGKILEIACEHMGISKEEVMIFGDGMNDITMFERFPHGYAPANSAQGILDVAEFVVAHFEDDGFAEAVYHMLERVGVCN
ncbi:MAG: Cof-type HAD-IIB family hydrolase [Streptococcaceae bacterium]|jgi:Cof subfamily protein (haloacid dehalogenase superfamily)|nr:Cof-type HAD-IIB family hydrolase [Streptococcaceae bacterium]